jgi:hypothetical protein
VVEVRMPKYEIGEVEKIERWGHVWFHIPYRILDAPDVQGTVSPTFPELLTVPIIGNLYKRALIKHDLRFRIREHNRQARKDKMCTEIMNMSGKRV